MANMSGGRLRTIEFLDTGCTIATPLDRMGGLSAKRTDWSRSNFEIFYEPFLCPEANHSHLMPPYTWDPTLYSPFYHIPRALQAANVQIVKGISVDLPSIPLSMNSDSGKTLFEALSFLKLKSFSSRTEKLWYPHDGGFLTACMAVPTLERISLEGPTYKSQYELKASTRIHISQLERELLSRYMPALAHRVTAAAAIGITTSGENNSGHYLMHGQVEEPNILINRNLRCVHLRGGVFQLKDLRELLQSFPRTGLDAFSIRDARLLRDEDGMPGHPQELEPNVVGTRSWEKVLDLLREGPTVRRGRPGNFQLRRVCTRISLDYTDLKVAVFTGIWGDEAPWSYKKPWKPMAKLVELGLGPEPASPAEEYVTRVSDVNPIRARREREEEDSKNG